VYRQLWKPRRAPEDNIKMDPKETGCALDLTFFKIRPSDNIIWTKQWIFQFHKKQRGVEQMNDNQDFKVDFVQLN
jgi:hypothetical protein